MNRLTSALLEAGAWVLFGHTVEAMRHTPAHVALTVTDPDHTAREITADFVVSCDGAASVVGRALAEGNTDVEVSQRRHSGQWLVLTAACAPLVGHTIYAAHPRGFAGHMRRGPNETRYYLEILAMDNPLEWPENALRRELNTRLGMESGLDRARFSSLDTLHLRVQVTSPMQHGRVSSSPATPPT